MSDKNINSPDSLGKKDNNTNDIQDSTNNNDNLKENDVNVEKKRVRRKKKRKIPEENNDKRRIKRKKIKKPNKKPLFYLSGIAIALIGAYFGYSYLNQDDSNPQATNQQQKVVVAEKAKIIEAETFANKKTDYSSYSYRTPFSNWKESYQYELKDAVLKHSISPKFYQSSVNSKKMEELWGNKDAFTNVMDGTDIQLLKNGYARDQTLGLTLSDYGQVINILQDSPAYANGIRLKWNLLKIEDRFISNFPSDYQSVDKLIQNKKTTWLTSNKRTVVINPMKVYPAIGSIAEGWFKDNIYTIKIYHISSVTPGRIVQLLGSVLAKKQNIKGIVLDLRDTDNNDYYKGLPETAWLFNKQKEEVLAVIIDRNNKQYNITSKGVAFSFSPQVASLLKRVPVVTVVNNKTSGSFEILANNIKQNGGIIMGEKTAGKSELTTPFLFGEDKGINLTTFHIKLPNNVTLPITPNKTFPSNSLDFLYIMNKSY